MSELDAATNSKIRLLCSQGEKLSKLGDFDRAISKYYEALTLLPTLHERNQIAAFLYASIGEAYWSMKDYENAGESFCEAYECPGMNENAQITLRIGQCLTECGDTTNARDYLRHAVRLGGDELIMNADRKYYEVLYPASQQAQEPPQSGAVYASGITRGSSPAAGRAGQQTFSYKDKARQSGTYAQQSTFNMAFAPDAQPEEAQPEAGTGDAVDIAEATAAVASAISASDASAPTASVPAAQPVPEKKLSESAFGFVTEVFTEQPEEPRPRPHQPSRFELAAEDMKNSMNAGDASPAHDMFNPGSAARETGASKPGTAEEPLPQDKPEEQEKPAKKGFFSRLFGKK